MTPKGPRTTMTKEKITGIQEKPENIAKKKKNRADGCERHLFLHSQFQVRTQKEEGEKRTNGKEH